MRNNTEYQREWRVKNRDRYNAYQREYAKNNQEKRKLLVTKQKEKRHQQANEIAGRPRPSICESCGGGGKIYFDHNHKTGKFRGWICQGCNSALGHARDNVEVLYKLIAYLQTDKSINQ